MGNESIADEKEYTDIMFSDENKEDPAKRYKCLYCKTEFAKQKILRQHIPNHTGEC